MKKITIAELKNKTSDFIAAAQNEPVFIDKDDRSVAAIISQLEHDRLIRLETNYWLDRINRAEKTGYVGTEATRKLFQKN